jgi:hypothetical protein
MVRDGNASTNELSLSILQNLEIWVAKHDTRTSANRSLRDNTLICSCLSQNIPLKSQIASLIHALGRKYPKSCAQRIIQNEGLFNTWEKP